jgi:hypothetical protein
MAAAPHGPSPWRQIDRISLRVPTLCYVIPNGHLNLDDVENISAPGQAMR